MGGGKKHNGKRPVNKVDGGKGKAKKQMSKTRREDAKKEVIEELKPKAFLAPPVRYPIDFFDDEYDDDLFDDDDDGFGDW